MNLSLQRWSNILYQHKLNTYLFLLFIKVVNDDTNEEVEGEETAKNNEEDKVKIHVDVDFSDGLLAKLINK